MPLADYQEDVNQFFAQVESNIEKLGRLGFADPNTQSNDDQSDGYAESIFLRAFTGFEKIVEKSFLHFLTSGLTLNGLRAPTHLSTEDVSKARAIMKHGFKFISCAKPQDILGIANTYLHEGWPFTISIATGHQVLTDIEKVRNRIAHSSSEAQEKYEGVIINLFQTRRTFDMTPGQLLRARHRQSRSMVAIFYLQKMREAIETTANPPEPPRQPVNPAPVEMP